MTCNTGLLDEYSMLLLEILLLLNIITKNKKLCNKKFIILVLSTWIASIYIHNKTNHLIHPIIITKSVLLLLFYYKKKHVKAILIFILATFLWLLNLHKIVNDNGFFHGLWHIMTAYSLNKLVIL